MALLNATDANVSIDDFHAGVVGVTNASTFVVQGPKGRQWTVRRAPAPLWTIRVFPSAPSPPIRSWKSPASSILYRTISTPRKLKLCRAIILFSAGSSRAFGPLPGLPCHAGGPFRPVRTAGCHRNYRREIETLNVDNTMIYKIANINNPITSLLFNNSSLAAGQVVDVGGKLVTSNGVSSLTVHRIVFAGRVRRERGLRAAR